MSDVRQPTDSPPVVLDNTTEPRHDLGAEEFAAVEAALVRDIESHFAPEGIYVARISAHHAYANLVRTLEHIGDFAEVADLMAPYEPNFVFLAVVDTRGGARRVIHAFRIGLPEFGSRHAHDLTGMALLDDMITSDQGLSLESVQDYYESRGVSLAQAMSVETNFKVGEKVKSPIPGIRISDFGYLSVFYLLQEREAPLIFAHQNHVALVSLGQLGLRYDPIAGVEDLRTPSLDDAGQPYFDDRYTPLALPASRHNVQVFRDLAAFTVPEVAFHKIGVPQAILHLPTTGPAAEP
jgi:hypothetical protein